MNILLKNKPRGFFLLLSLAFSFFLAFFAFPALADYEIYFTDFNIEKASFDPGEEVKGSFTVWNYENSFIPDLTYRFKLLAKDSDGNFFAVWDDQPSGDRLSLSSGQKLGRSFTYKLPKNLAAGDYKFKVQVYNPGGESIVWKKVSITINKTQGSVLVLQNGNFLRNGAKLGEEVLYSAGETPKITFDVLSKSSSAVKAHPVLSIYRDDVNGTPIRKIEESVVDLNPGYVQNEKADLIQVADPNPYICKVVMHDQSGDPVSNAIYFRWGISETGGTAIAEVKTDQSSYDPGDQASVSVDIGTQEGETTEKADVLVKIMNEKKEVVGEMTQEVDLKGGEVNVSVPITKGVSDPKVEVTILDKNNKQLDQFPIGGASTSQPNKEETNSNIWLIVACSVVIILATVAVVIFSKKKKTPLGGAMIIILALAGLFLGCIQGVKAETIVGSGPLPLDVDWMDPMPLFYNAGGYVKFSGEVKVKHGLGKTFENSQIDVFVANLEPLVLKTDPSGIKLIDENNANNKKNMMKIGSLPVFYDSAEGAATYDVSLKIPQEFTHLGEARFYLQFSGQRVITSGIPFIPDVKIWSWLIAYQKVTIQSSTEGGFDISLEADKTKASPGDIVTYTIKVENKSPCVRISTDVAMVLDYSGTMACPPENCSTYYPNFTGKTRWDYAKEASNVFLDVMNPVYDQISLVTYQTGSSLDSAATTTFSSVKDKIDVLANPSMYNLTCISCGINRANKEIVASKRSEAVQYEVLMTDGMANTSICSADDTSAPCVAPNQEAIDMANASGARIFTVGFGGGADFNETLLETIAASTAGTYSYAPTGPALKDIFEAIAGALVGKSLGTTVEVIIPTDYFTVEEYDHNKCSITTKPDGSQLLECTIGDMDCGNKTTETIKFKLRVRDDITEEIDIETKAKVINNSGQEKVDIFEISVSGKNPPEAIIYCNPDECDVNGCGHDCCQCYTDSFLKLENRSKAKGHTTIYSSTWYTKKEGDADYSFEASILGKKDFPERVFSAGNYTVKLEVVNDKGALSSTERIISYLQGADAGFACSMNGNVWYDCESDDFKPAKGETIWLTDDPLLAIDPQGNILDHSTPSFGATGLNASRSWYTMDGLLKKTLGQDDQSTITMVIEELPTVVRLEYNDGERSKTVTADHSISMIPVPKWIETDPFKNQ